MVKHYAFVLFIYVKTRFPLRSLQDSPIVFEQKYPLSRFQTGKMGEMPFVMNVKGKNWKYHPDIY